MTVPSIVVLLLLLGATLLWFASRQRRKSGIPRGRIVYEDVGIGTPRKPLLSSRYMLVGKPDYIVEKDGSLIPVEVKSHPAPRIPYRSHRFQLLAYCLLLEENTGTAPPYGILKYKDRDFKIEYDEEARKSLLQIMDEIRASAGSKAPLPKHNNPSKCARCPYREICEVSLT